MTKLFLVIVILIVTIASSPLDLAAVDPYEVKFILNPNFPDTSRSWKLKAGMRQLLVQDIFPPWDKITPKEISPEVLKKLAEKANVSISGKATGSKAFLATFYSIALYGPNNFNSFREKKRFDKRGNYTFTGLPKGQYQIKVYADPGKADLPYTLKPPVPSYRVVNCTTGNAVNQDFKFE